MITFGASHDGRKHQVMRPTVTVVAGDAMQTNDIIRSHPRHFQHLASTPPRALPV